MTSAIQALTPEQVQVQALMQAVDLMEKTNQQLGLWSNPYGIMVATLSVLFTISAMVFAFVLWRQGKEYRSMFESFLKEQKILLEIEIKKVVGEAKEILDKSIQETELGLDSLTGEMKKKAENEISLLKARRQSLDYVPVTVTNTLRNASLSSVAGGVLVGNPLSTTYSALDTFPVNLGFSNAASELCGKCGFYNQFNSKFCASCGSEIK